MRPLRWVPCPYVASVAGTAGVAGAAGTAAGVGGPVASRAARRRNGGPMYKNVAAVLADLSRGVASGARCVMRVCVASGVCRVCVE